MRHRRKTMAALLAGALLLTLAGCGQEAAGPGNNTGTGTIPAVQTSSEDFQKNMHQSSALRLRRNKLYETEEGIFFQTWLICTEDMVFPKKFSNLPPWHRVCPTVLNEMQCARAADSVTYEISHIGERRGSAIGS